MSSILSFLMRRSSFSRVSFISSVKRSNFLSSEIEYDFKEMGFYEDWRVSVIPSVDFIGSNGSTNSIDTTWLILLKLVPFKINFSSFEMFTHSFF